MKYCTNCGSEIVEGADLCLNCGHFIKKANINKLTQNNKYSKLAIVSFILVLLMPIFAFGTINIMGMLANYFSKIDDFLFITFLIILLNTIVITILSIAGFFKVKKLNLKGKELSIVAIVISFLELAFALFLTLSVFLAAYTTF